MTARHDRPSVLVAGAGPVGLAAANRLARNGARVRIIDSNEAPTPFSKALGINSRTLDILEPSGLSAKLIAAGQKIRRMNLHEGSRRLAAIHLDRLEHRYNFLLILPQSETERLLAEDLTELGVEVERGVTLTGFTQSDGGVTATVERGGEAETLEAGYLVGADGAHSQVRKTLGAGFPGAAHEHQWSLADVHLDDWPYGDDEAAIFMHRDGMTMLVIPLGRPVGQPMGPRLFRAIATVPDVLSHLPFGRVRGAPVWQSDFATSHRIVESYGSGRVFLCGDAAHIHSPAGGRGMNLGIEDATVLADRICTGGLETYSDDRRIVGRSIVAQTDAILATAGRRDPLGRALRNLAIRFLLPLEPVQRRLRWRLAGLAD